MFPIKSSHAGVGPAFQPRTNARCLSPIPRFPRIPDCLSTMLRAGIAALLFAVPALGWDIGFDFRASTAFVSDPSSVTPVLGTTTYPTTRTVNGVTVVFGWESTSPAGSTRDRGNYTDPRLAGINCGGNNSGAAIFRVDLPTTGWYSVSLAIGDLSYDQYYHIGLMDSGSLLLSLNGQVTAGTFIDATGAPLFWQAWPSANMTILRTFSTTQFRIQLGGKPDLSGTESCLAHLRLSSAITPPPPPVRSFILQ